MHITFFLTFKKTDLLVGTLLHPYKSQAKNTSYFFYNKVTLKMPWSPLAYYQTHYMFGLTGTLGPMCSIRGLSCSHPVPNSIPPSYMSICSHPTMPVLVRTRLHTGLGWTDLPEHLLWGGLHPQHPSSRLPSLPWGHFYTQGPHHTHAFITTFVHCHTHHIAMWGSFTLFRS